MARSKKSPQVARPTGKRRAIELFKDLVILALTCSAVLLVLQTPIANQVRGWVTPPLPSGQSVAQRREQAAFPYALAVRNGQGLYGASYDQALVGHAVELLSPYLGEAFATAEDAEAVSLRQFQLLLDEPGVYCAFQGSPPLEVLASFLGTEGALTGPAQCVLLSWDGSQIWLGWRDGSRCYRARTAVAYQDHLAPALEDFNPNGAAFAYSLARSDRAYDTLDPLVLVSMTAPQPPQFSAAAPDLVADGEALEQLLNALDFQSGVGSAYRAGSDLAINESGDRLRVSPDGTVSFHAGDDERYPVSGPGIEGAALTAWDLLNRAALPWKGELSYVLTGAEAVSDGWRFTFQARLQGIPLRMGSDGSCASFTVSGGRVDAFTLSLRTYTPTGAVTTLPGERLAAAAMHSLPDSGGRLMLCYRDGGGATLSAGWLAEE